jgi:hypothetical protein
VNGRNAAARLAWEYEIRTPLNGVLGMAQIGYRRC